MNKDSLMNSNHSLLFISLLSHCFYKYCSKSLFYNNTKPHTSILVQNSLLFYSKEESVCTKRTIVLR